MRGPIRGIGPAQRASVEREEQLAVTIKGSDQLDAQPAPALKLAFPGHAARCDSAAPLPARAMRGELVSYKRMAVRIGVQSEPLSRLRALLGPGRCRALSAPIPGGWCYRMAGAARPVGRSAGCCNVAGCWRASTFRS